MDSSESYTNFNFAPVEPFSVPKYVDPVYLFGHLKNFIMGLVHLIFQGGTLGLLHTLGYVFAIFFLTLIAYCAVRMLEIRQKEHHHLLHEIEEYRHHQAERDRAKWNGDGAPRNDRWTAVLNHLFTENLNDWKLAIIEADSMLDSLLTQLNFSGASTGEKLRSANRDQFRSLTQAWEVHTIRNQIAHEGLNFTMSHYEAKRVIAIYEQIFKEFGYI